MDEQDTAAANDPLTGQSPDESGGTAAEPAVGAEPAVRLETPVSRLRWCSKCQQQVLPVVRDPHRCPTCKTFVGGPRGGSSINLKVQARILAGLKRDYRPASETEEAQCRALARVIAKLDVVRADGAAHQRLVAQLKELKATLDESRAARVEKPPVDLSMVSTEQLIADVGALHDRLIQTLEGEIADQARVAAQRREAALAAIHAKPVPEPPVPEPEPVPVLCPYCKKTIEQCAAMRESPTRVDNWAALHHGHPAEVERRRKAATAEMMRPGAGVLPDWYR
jgi:hypothetical protein